MALGEVPEVLSGFVADPEVVVLPHWLPVLDARALAVGFEAVVVKTAHFLPWSNVIHPKFHVFSYTAAFWHGALIDGVFVDDCMIAFM